MYLKKSKGVFATYAARRTVVTATMNIKTTLGSKAGFFGEYAVTYTTDLFFRS